MPRGRGRVTRFTVMAMLQAARAEQLGLPRASAYSWGLNRAIFYAAAKRGFRGGSGASSGAAGGEAPAKKLPEREAYLLGDDEAYRDPKSDPPLFTIGDEDQTPDDFERQVAARFGSKENFHAAWAEAMAIIAGYDRATLESRRGFFDEVYKPRRDDLAEAWSQKYGAAPAGK
jgi:hypothetical protein